MFYSEGDGGIKKKRMDAGWVKRKLENFLLL